MGAIELKKGIDQFAAQPGTVLFGVDLSGNPVIKDENGVVSPAVSLDGSPLAFNEQGSDPSTAAGQMKIYAKRVTGTLGLYQRAESDGAITEIGAGGGAESGWFAGGGSELVTVSYTSGAPEVYQTSIPYPSVGSNQITFVRMIMALAEDGSGLGFYGLHNTLLFHGTAPSGPEDFSGLVYDDGGVFFPGGFSIDFGIDASDNLNLTMSHSGDVAGYIQVEVGLGTSLGFAIGG